MGAGVEGRTPNGDDMSNVPQNSSASQHSSIALEQSYLVSVFEKPEIYQPGQVAVDYFTTDLHRKLIRYVEESGPCSLDIAISTLRANNKITDHDVEVLADLVQIGGIVPTSTKEGLEKTATALRTLTANRKASRTVTDMDAALCRGRLDEVRGMLPELQKVLSDDRVTDAIKGFDDIPDLFSLSLPEMRFVVPDLITEGSVTQWTGKPGCKKSMLTLDLGVAVATGREFLGRQCQKMPVLILDYEMPGAEQRDRLEAAAGGPVPGLRIWGGWCPEPPPLISDHRLLDFAKQERGLICVDPLRLSHRAEKEDSSDDMTPVMADMRRLAQAGATVIFVHHPSKSEGSTSRGSGVLTDLSDCCLLQTRDDETGLITLKHFKALFIEAITLTIAHDFDTAQFRVVDSPQFTEKSLAISKLLAFISAHPGISQNELVKLAGISKAGAAGILRAGNGTNWTVKPGPRNSKMYFPLTTVQVFTTVQKTGGTVGTDCSPVLSPLGENSEQSRKPVVIDRTPGWAEAVKKVFRPFTGEEKNTVYDVIVKATGCDGARLREHVLPLGTFHKRAWLVMDSQEIADHVWPCLRSRMTDPDVIARLSAIGIDGLDYRIPKNA
jgi:hypothetical protein